MKHLLLLTFMAAVVPTGTAEAIDITDPAQVASLRAVQQNLDTVTDAVMRCIDAGRPHAACLCEHEKLVTQFNDSVATLISRHPELSQVDLVHFNSKRPAICR